jgi:phospholipid/cholesterol/gamma-HCH transport system permease protein
MIKLISSFGKFVYFFLETIFVVDSFRSLWKNFIDESVKVGVKSVFIVCFISLFTGAVSAIQTAYNLTSSYIPDYIVAMVVRDTMFSLIPTLIALVYAGKVGSNISGELGTMKITEQVDALDVMGLNSKSFLVLPKLLASIFMFPALVMLALFMALLGGYVTVLLTGIITGNDYIIGIRNDYNSYIFTIVMVKSLVFSILVPMISSYYGYTTSGGALEVGKSSTASVITSCIAILAGDFLLTQLLAGK